MNTHFNDKTYWVSIITGIYFGVIYWFIVIKDKNKVPPNSRRATNMSRIGFKTDKRFG